MFLYISWSDILQIGSLIMSVPDYNLLYKLFCYNDSVPHIPHRDNVCLCSCEWDSTQFSSAYDTAEL